MVLKQVEAMLKSDGKLESRLNNVLSIIKYEVEDVSWVGFYWINEAKDTLDLGAFQGKSACMEIPIPKGVCGKAFYENRPIAVPDVNKFEGHIACDSDTKSEIVLPINVDGNTIGVLDIDSLELNRFKSENIQYFREIVKNIEEEIKKAKEVK